MDTGSSCTASISEDFGKSVGLKGLHLDPLQDVSLNELGNCLTEILHIQEQQKMTSNSFVDQSADLTHNLNMEIDDEYKYSVEIESTSLIAEKCLSKSDTFPCSSKKPLVNISVDGEDKEGKDDVAAAAQMGSESNKTAYPRSISLPTPLKLVSAMKGSREKQGIFREKLTVTWGPDVYDPPPSFSSSSSVIINKPRRKGERKKNFDSKKNGKNKQKRKSSKGGSSKDKKLVQKYSGSSHSFNQSLEEEDKLKYEGFEVGKTDSYCGSTFLKQSVTKVHLSVTEAT